MHNIAMQQSRHMVVCHPVFVHFVWSNQCSILCNFIQVKVLLKWRLKLIVMTSLSVLMTRPCLCTVCNKRFRSRKSLDCHKLTHSGDKLYSCSQCQKRFPNQQCLRKHMNAHSSKYKCTECGKCFGSNHDLIRHRRVHTGEKPFECSVCSNVCSECPKCFCTAAEVRQHHSVHLDYKQFCCSLCDKSFRRKESVKEHFKKCSVSVWFDIVYCCYAWSLCSCECSGVLCIYQLFVFVHQQLSVYCKQALYNSNWIWCNCYTYYSTY